MPRTTRAAFRAQQNDDEPQIFEDHDNVTPDESTSNTNNSDPRPIFGELVGNNIPKPEPATHIITVDPMPVKKGKKGGKKAGKKNNLNLVVSTANSDSTRPEVLEDENQSDSSEAADAAAEELREVKHSETPVPMDMDRPKTPPNVAAREASKLVLQSPMVNAVAKSGAFPNTPKFDPTTHKEEVSTENCTELEEDSFVEDITTRSPSKIIPALEEREDSFVEDIKTRSPTKATPALRIEDSVTEMDALEDAIEKIAGELPVIADRDTESPVLTRTETLPAAPASTSPNRKTAPTTTVATKPLAKKSKPSAVISTTAAKTAKPSASSRTSTVRASTVRASVKPAARPSVLPSKQRASSSEAPATSMSFSASPSKPQGNTIRKRAPGSTLSTSKPAFVPTKSAKPATTSSFKLPGEEIAAKLKAQREERIKREEEAAAKDAAKKVARPTNALKPAARLSTLAAPKVQPRETKTSQARQSLMLGKDTKQSSTEDKENQAPVKAATVRSRPAPSATKDLAVRKRTSLPTASAADANSAKPRARPSTLAPAAAHRKVSTTRPSDSDVARRVISKPDGREVFSRGLREQQDLEKMKREKEDAAKKARADAAERGRVASREWAEKQRKKALADAKAKPVAQKEQQDMPTAVAVV